MKIKSYQPILALLFVSGILQAAPIYPVPVAGNVTVDGNAQVTGTTLLNGTLTVQPGSVVTPLAPNGNGANPINPMTGDVGATTTIVRTKIGEAAGSFDDVTGGGAVIETNGNATLNSSTGNTVAVNFSRITEFQVFNADQGALAGTTVPGTQIWYAATETSPGSGVFTKIPGTADFTSLVDLNNFITTTPVTNAIFAPAATSTPLPATGGNLVVGGTANIAGQTTTNGITNTGNVGSTTSSTTGAATVGGTLGVTGATTTAGITNAGNIGTTTLGVSGLSTTAGIANTGNIGTTTLGVSGLSTTNGIANTGNIGTTTLATTSNATIGGNLGVTGLTSTNGIANTGAIGTDTLLVRGTAQFNARIATNGVDNVGDIQTDALVVRGATTLRGLASTNGINNTGAINTSTLNVAGVSNFSGPVNSNGIFNNFERITGVGNGINQFDAVNRGQLDNETAARIAGDSSLQSQVDQNTRGIAMVAAMTNTRVEAGKCHGIDFNLAQYQSETGFAFGYANRINDNLQIQGAIASTTDFDESVVRVGLSYQW